MTEIGTYERKPIAIIYEEKSAYKDTYAGAEDIVFLEAHHLIPSDPKTDAPAEKADAEPKADAPAEKADAEPKADAPAEKAE